MAFDRRKRSDLPLSRIREHRVDVAFRVGEEADVLAPLSESRSPGGRRAGQDYLVVPPHNLGWSVALKVQLERLTRELGRIRRVPVGVASHELTREDREPNALTAESDVRLFTRNDREVERSFIESSELGHVISEDRNSFEANCHCMRLAGSPDTDARSRFTRP